jgi:hypothetical protein
MTLQPAMGQEQPPKPDNDVTDRILSRQQAWREVQEHKQVEFLLWTAAAVGLLSLLTWRVRYRTQSAAGGVVPVAMAVIVLDFALAVVTGVSLLSPTANMISVWLFIICYWAAIPHLVAVCILLVGSWYAGFSRRRVFVAGLGLLTPLLFFLVTALDNGWSAPDLWTPGPERLSWRVQNAS